jgi:4-amino-4-deoxy-L-arabinose transferase-like glycosyltransferase
MKYLLALVVVLLLGLNLGLNLSTHTFAEFDESRHVVSAVEMRESGHYLVNTYMHEPDYWNVKPPLSMWAVAATYPVLDNKLVSTRLPGVLACLLTCLVIFVYGRRHAGMEAGLMAVALFLTSRKYILCHGPRTADADSLFILFISLAMLLLATGRRWFIALSYACLGLAFMSKSFHVLPYGAVVFLYTVYLCRRGTLSLWSVFWLPLFFLLPVLPWVVARWQVDGSRFFEVMVLYDLLKRSGEAIEGHTGSIAFYLVVLVQTAWPALLAIAALATRRLSRPVLSRPEYFLLLLWLAVTLLAYSVASSKCPWYIFPVIPALSILAASWAFDKDIPLAPAWRRGIIVFLLLSLVAQEARIMHRLLHAQTPPVVSSLQRLSREHAGTTVAVTLVGTEWRQHYYATAITQPNILPLLPGRNTVVPGTALRYVMDADGRVWPDPATNGGK